MIIPSHRRKMQTKRKYNIFCSQYALNIVSFFTLSFAFIMYQNILFHQGNKQTHNKRDRAKSLYKILNTEALTKIQVITAPLPRPWAVFQLDFLQLFLHQRIIYVLNGFDVTNCILVISAFVFNSPFQAMHSTGYERPLSKSRTGFGKLSKPRLNSKFTVFNCLYTMNRKFKRYPPQKDPDADIPKSDEQRENTSELLTLICKVTDARAAVVLYTIDEVDRRLRGRSSNTRPSLDRL